MSPKTARCAASMRSQTVSAKAGSSATASASTPHAAAVSRPPCARQVPAGHGGASPARAQARAIRSIESWLPPSTTDPNCRTSLATRSTTRAQSCVETCRADGLIRSPRNTAALPQPCRTEASSAPSSPAAPWTSPTATKGCSARAGAESQSDVVTAISLKVPLAREGFRIACVRTDNNIARCPSGRSIVANPQYKAARMAR